MDNDVVVAGNNSCNRLWAVCGGSDAISLLYGPIGIVLLPGFCGNGKEGSQNMGGTEVIWGGQQRFELWPNLVIGAIFSTVASTHQ
jgi:hypothetical protein